VSVGREAEKLHPKMCQRLGRNDCTAKHAWSMGVLCVHGCVGEGSAWQGMRQRQGGRGLDLGAQACFCLLSAGRRPTHHRQLLVLQHRTLVVHG